MYSAYNAKIDKNMFHFIKSERMKISDRNIFVSYYTGACEPNDGSTYNAIQGLGSMNRPMSCDYAENPIVKSINRIRYGQISTTNGLMAAGSRIFIWGIDDDE
jgi:hypothetical protein